MDLTQAIEAPPSPARPRIDHERGRLRGTRCPHCGAVSWPSRVVCQRCGSDGLEAMLLTDLGTLITYTRVWVPMAGLPTPYIVGQVDLDDGVRVFAHGRDLDAVLRVPVAVRLVVDPDPGAVPPFWFEMREAG